MMERKRNCMMYSCRVAIIGIDHCWEPHKPKKLVENPEGSTSQVRSDLLVLVVGPVRVVGTRAHDVVPVLLAGVPSVAALDQGHEAPDEHPDGRKDHQENQQISKHVLYLQKIQLVY